ncbi:MAG: hypothetical protein OXH38_05770 [Chloroflexi bacterium]|nr:hypothetical protein [Chloroflexota bacterium]
MGVRVLLVVSMLGLWFVISPTNTRACSCAPPGSPTEALAESELAFRGTVTSIGPSDEAGLLRVDFDVATVWKGIEAEAISLTTRQDTAACGYAFEERVEYVVYSWNGVDVARCSRTAPIELAGEDLAAFEVGTQTGGVADFPNTGNAGLADVKSPPDRLATAAAVGATGAILLGAAGARLYVRRHDEVRNATKVDRT